MLKNHLVTSDTTKTNSEKLPQIQPTIWDVIRLNELFERDVVNSPAAPTEVTEITESTTGENSSLSSRDRTSLDTSIEVELLSSDSLDLTDATVTDSLFGLDSPSVGVTDSTSEYTLRASYDPIDYGDPITDASYWRKQAGSASCAVVAQISVYESLTGYRVTETAACNYAQSQGWFSPRTGTPLGYMGKLLNALGIDTYGGSNANLRYLADALDYGDKPIVGLDANEIWFAKRDRYGRAVEQPNAGHAVWVTGIDVKPNGAVNVILNDSGTSNGRATVVSSIDFYNAWQDYGYYTVVADNPYT